MRSDQSSDKSIVVAAIVAGGLMLIMGLTYRVLAGHMWSPARKPPLAPEALDRLPLQIADWIGQDIPVDPRVMRAAGTDAQVSRQYVRRGGAEAVSLYIGAGTRVADVLVHNPPACYVAAGWSVVDRRSGELSLGEEGRLPCTVLEFSRGRADKGKLIILHYIVLDDQVFRDMHAVRQAVRPGFRTVDFTATVQILASGAGLSTDFGTQWVTDFATDSAATIGQLFAELEHERQDAQSDQSIATE